MLGPDLPRPSMMGLGLGRSTGIKLPAEGVLTVMAAISTILFAICEI